MKYLIDGYNLIHKIEKLRGRRLRSQRDGLVRLLEMAQAQNRQLKDLTVVFDGQAQVVAPRISSAVGVIFSRGKSADKKIKDILESSNYARDIGVVSDDREVRCYAARLGAKKIAVKEFLKRIYPTPLEQKEHTFKLDDVEAEKINQELEKIWLNR